MSAIAPPGSESNYAAAASLHAGSRVGTCPCTTGDLSSRIIYFDDRNFVIAFSAVLPEVPAPPVMQTREYNVWRWNDKILPFTSLVSTVGIIIGGILYATDTNKTFIVGSTIAFASTVALSVGATAVKATYVGCTALQNGARAFCETWRDSLCSPFKPKGIISNTVLASILTPCLPTAAIAYICN